MPIAAISLANMEWNKTGSWRYMRPVYQYKTAPCIPACPASEKIPRYLRSLVRGDPNEAWTTVIKDNPFPSVCGRVCRAPCEAACNRGRFDESVSIRALERHVGDWGRKNGIFTPVILEKGKRVAVIGAGAAGLAAAFALRLEGYGVDVYEAKEKPGGALRYVIPSFRLPEEVLDGEIELIRKTGVKIITGVRIGKDKSLEDLFSYDAVLVANGTWREQALGMDGEKLSGVYSDWRFLSSVKNGEKLSLGRRVAVIGTGDSALDSARTLVRLRKQVVLVFERSKGEIPSSQVEVEDAVREGVEIRQMTHVRRIVGENGKVRGLECVSVALGKPDASGRRLPVPVEGSEKVLEVEGVVWCTGARPDLDFVPEFLRGKDGSVCHDADGVTAHEKVFLVNPEALGGAWSIPTVIGAGARAAQVLRAKLEGTPVKDTASKREIVHYDTLNLLYFRSAKRAERLATPPEKARGSFEECELPLGPEEALREAGRCMSCGVCTECDNCLIFCPDVAITKLKKGYKINLDFCKGCGVCVHECPRNCMSLVEEMKWKK
jgi:NADPH-dependent glutamate synthase beta subunit-like oxidoreductase